MSDLEPSSHIFRHIKKSWIDGDFVDPAAFRLRQGIELGLSVNWVEYFERATPAEAVQALGEVLEKKGRRVGGESRFALLNVGEAKLAAARYVRIEIVRDEEPGDPSHSLVVGYSAYNDQVAEELAKVVMATLPAKP